MLLNTKAKWDGETLFGVLDEKYAEKRLHDEQAFFNDLKSGQLKFKRVYRGHNKLTNYGRNYLAQILTGMVPMPLILPSKMELGTGTGTPSATDVDLWSPSIGTLKQTSNIQVYLQYYAQFITTWQTSDPIQGAWTEEGLKDASGNLWAHVASAFTVNSGEMLVGQWTVQIIGN